MVITRRRALRAAALTAGLGLSYRMIERGGAVATPPLMQAPAVPQPFQPLYAYLDRELSRVETAVTEAFPAPGAPRMAGELITANSNRGRELLRPGTVEASALLLDRFVDIGLRAATLSINFPMLTARLEPAADFLDFYRAIAEAVRTRGLALVVETTTIFPDPEFSSLGIDYRDLTLAAYQQGKREQAAVILRELRPDYLTVENESTTVTRNTGLDFPVEAYLATVRSTIDGLERGATRVGAGSGSWDDVSLFERLAAETAVDYVDVHVYPIQGDLLWDRLARIAETARAHGKGLSVGESWLYKIAPNEPAGAQATAVNVFGRDLYGFWSPLDQRFIALMATLAGGLAMEFCSLFWVQYLFSYIDFTPELAQSGYAQRQRLLNAAAFAAIASGALSPTGAALKDRLR